MVEPNRTVLLVEDDEALGRLTAEYLRGSGLEVEWVRDGAQAVSEIQATAPAVVVLDLGLPGLDGLSVLRAVRHDFAGRILILTSSVDDADEIAGMELGADGFLSKPVRPRVLLARLRAALRNQERVLVTEQDGVLVAGRITVNPGTRSATLDDSELTLTSLEFDLLEYFANNAGIILSRDDISMAMRGREHDGLERWVDLRVSQLRKALGTPGVLKTVRGRGYLLVRA